MTEVDIRALVEREEIRSLILRTAVLLDEEDLDEWLRLYSDTSEYEIATYGTEIRQDMAWWKSDREELRKILEDVPRQVRDTARRLHLVTPTKIQSAGGRGVVHSNFAVFRTTPEGKTSVYVVGTYVDSVVRKDGCWLYEKHRVVLHTRMLDAFTHLPL
jgi:3-phenylpropionate/cinnamic acid dioxygenase small subunit